MDGIDGFLAAYAKGRIVALPELFAKLIVIPGVLHTPWSVFESYPPAVQAATLAWLPLWLAAGQGMNLEVVHAD